MNASQGSTSSANSETDMDRSDANVPNSEDCRDPLVVLLSCSEAERAMCPFNSLACCSAESERTGLDEIRRGVLDVTAEAVGENVAGETGVLGVARDISDDDSYLSV